MNRRFVIKSIVLSLLALILPVPFLSKLENIFRVKPYDSTIRVKNFTPPTELLLHSHSDDFLVIPDNKWDFSEGNFTVDIYYYPQKENK
jgi:hypothetical protein|tara:strand:+ start:1979 stop:2245 length:267 start_codon:yes stop_codon:yes gene_type:complete